MILLYLKLRMVTHYLSHSRNHLLREINFKVQDLNISKNLLQIQRKAHDYIGSYDIPMCK